MLMLHQNIMHNFQFPHFLTYCICFALYFRPAPPVLWQPQPFFVLLTNTPISLVGLHTCMHFFRSAQRRWARFSAIFTIPFLAKEMFAFWWWGWMQQAKQRYFTSSRWAKLWLLSQQLASTSKRFSLHTIILFVFSPIGRVQEHQVHCLGCRWAG